MPSPSSGRPSAPAFATVLRRQREDAGLTQAELADRAGIGVRTVSNLERGINTSPYPSTVRLLADALDLPDSSRDELLTAAGRRPATSDVLPAEAPAGGYLGARAPGPIVGRATERAEIGDALDAAARGEGAVVLLAGEPGIGKTRLAQEAMADATARGFLVAGGRCFEQQAGVAFAPVLEAFAALHHAAPAAVREGLAERWPALATLLPDQLRAAVPPADPRIAHDAVHALHRAATGFVQELAALHPVALVVDDLHWADEASADLLLHLVRHTHRDRFLLLGAYRDAEVGPAHPVRALAHALRRERLTRAVTVGRLDRDATAQLVSLRLAEPEPVAELGDLVHRSSEGNPFFTREIVTALVERGDLARVDGRWVCRGLDRIVAPLSVSEAIGQRVSRLPDRARLLLEAASVLGATFDPDDVPAGDARDDEVEQGWDDAVASGLLTLADDGYAFDHSLTQQALHLGMSPVRRRRLHREVGERLERRPVAARRRRAPEIAHHLEEGGLPHRALPYVLLAGEVAAAAHARAEAVRFLHHARELAEEVGDEESVTVALERTGRVELTAGRYDDALGPLLAAAERHHRTGDVGSRLRVEGMVADLQHRRGEGEAAAARLDELFADLRLGTGPDDDRVEGGAALANGLARVRLFLGEHERCVAATELAVRLARKEGSAAAEAEACAVGGTALFFLDRPADGIRVFEQGAAAASSIDAPALESGVLMGLQWATTIRGELVRSRALGERGLELTQRAGHTDQESQHAAGLGRTYFLGGDWDRAQHHFARSLELAAAGSPTLFSGIPLIYLGQLRAAQGDVAGAVACYDEAAGAPDIQTFAFAGYLQALRADLELQAGDAASALARVEPWLDQEAPTKVHDVAILATATEACLALGDHVRAEHLAHRGLRRAEAIDNQIDRVDVLRLLGRCHRLTGREAEARTYLDEALALAVRIGYPAAEARVRAELA